MKPADYDAWYDTERGRWIGETEYRLLRSLLALTPGCNALDVGCGTGWFSRRLAADGVETTGIDPDAEGLEFARQRGDGVAHYVEGDARQLPFATGAFDVVISVTALCFVADWPRALSEIARVSRGRFALGLLNRHGLLWREKGRGGGSGAYRGAHWHTKTEVAEVLSGLGVEHARFRFGVFVPSGSAIARFIERLAPSQLPFGSFFAVGGKAPRERRGSREGLHC